MVVRAMLLRPFTQCNASLFFEPRSAWPSVLPAIAWRGHILCGFDSKSEAPALDLADASFVESVKACYSELGLAEFARFAQVLAKNLPEIFRESYVGLAEAYGWRWNDRFLQTIETLASLPKEFQNWVDDKSVGPRDLSSLLSLPTPSEFDPFLLALIKLPFSKSEGVRAIELGVELLLLGSPLNELLPNDMKPSVYLTYLEKARRPMVSTQDDSLREDVAKWPWPSQVHGQWQRTGDQAGLEIKIRTTSPDDLMKKLEKLSCIRETWSCRS